MTAAPRTHAEILRAARERISDQRHFVMGALAWTRDGQLIDPSAPDAWRWNAAGAIRAEVGTQTEADRLYRRVDEAAWAIVKEQRLHFPAGTDVADNLGHALTLRALDDAIRLAEDDDPARHAAGGADGGAGG